MNEAEPFPGIPRLVFAIAPNVVAHALTLISWQMRKGNRDGVFADIS
jgi:hypothetical protein